MPDVCVCVCANRAFRTSCRLVSRRYVSCWSAVSVSLTNHHHSSSSVDVALALDAAKSAWRSVREKAASKSTELREVNRRAEVFHAELGMMLTWIGLSENKLASVTSPSTSRDSVARQLTEVQSLQVSANSHSSSVN